MSFWSALTDPFGTDARKKGVSAANDAILEAAKQYGLATSGIDYNVSNDMVNRYMSPDVSFRQNAATQGLAQIYGNSGALKSSGAQAGIANANAAIAAQAWADAFNRAQGITDSSNALKINRAQNAQSAAQGAAANSAALAMQNNGWLTNTANAIGGIGKGIGGISGLF
jgi:hypothetical protein